MQNLRCLVFRQRIQFELHEGLSIVRVRRTRTCHTGYAHPRTWNLAGRLVGAAKTLTC